MSDRDLRQIETTGEADGGVVPIGELANGAEIDRPADLPDEALKKGRDALKKGFDDPRRTSLSPSTWEKRGAD